MTSLSLIHRHLLCALLMAIGCSSTQDLNAGVLRLLEADNVGRFIGRDMELAEDAGGTLDFDTVSAPAFSSRFSPSTESIPNFGITKSVFWARFSMDAAGPRSDWIIHTAAPLMDRLDLYAKTPEGVEHLVSGRAIAFSQRPIPNRNPTFRIRAGEGKLVQIYMRFQTEDVMQLPVSVHTESQFFESDNKDSTGLGLYYGIMLIMALYNLFIFAATRERSYFHYVLFAIAAGYFIFTQSGHGGEYLWPDFPLIGRKLTQISVDLYALTALMFTRQFLGTASTPRLDVALRVGSIIAVVLAVLAPVIPYDVAAVINVYFALIVLVVIIGAGIRLALAGSTSAKIYVLAFGAFIVGGALYALRVVGLFPANFISRYGLQMGSVVEVALLSVALADRINRLRGELGLTVRELKSTNAELRRSERKYRSLIENTKDIVFSLDTAGRFTTVNHAVRAHLSYNPSFLIGRSIIDILPVDGDKTESFHRIYFREMIEKAVAKGRVNFRTQFKMLHGEPREMQVTLEYVDDPDSPVILGKAFAVVEDVLLRYFRSEMQTYVIDNLLTVSELVSQRLVRNLARYVPEDDLPPLQVALREVIVNAIEHGNLGISSDEKTEALNRGDYLAFVGRRQSDPAYFGRRVTVQSWITPERVVFRVTDQGDGFTFQDYTLRAPEEIMNSDLPHGRGIVMARHAFDRVRYQGRGNRVLLVKFVGAHRPP